MVQVHSIMKQNSLTNPSKKVSLKSRLHKRFKKQIAKHLKPAIMNDRVCLVSTDGCRSRVYSLVENISIARHSIAG